MNDSDPIADRQIDLLQKRTFGDVINTTFDFLSRNYKNMIMPILMFIMPILVIAGGIMGYNYQVTFNTFSPDSTGMPGAAGGILSIFSSLLLMISNLLILSIGYTYCLIYQEEGRDQLNTSYIIKRSLNNLWTVLGYGIVYFLILLPVAIIGALAMTASPFLFFIPFLLVIFFATRLSLMIYDGISEEEGIGTSISASWQLTKNRFWYTFGLIFVLSLIQGAIAFVFYLPFSGVVAAYGFNDFTESTLFSILFILSGVIIAVGISLTYLILSTGQAVLYYSLKEEKEGVSMLSEVEQIGKSGEDPADNEGDENYRDYFR